jgi:hypothetical protein
MVLLLIRVVDNRLPCSFRGCFPPDEAEGGRGGWFEEIGAIFSFGGTLWVSCYT